MKQKKWITAICLVALSGSIVACTDKGGSSNGNGNGGSSPVGSSNSPNATGSSPSPAPAKIPTVKIALSTVGSQYVEGSPNINEDKYVKKLRELSKTDVRFELIPHADAAQKTQLILAGGDLPDILQIGGISNPEIAPAIDNGVFYELNDLIDKYAPNLRKKIDKELWDSSLVSRDGKIYAIPGVKYLRNPVVFIRKDWLDKLKLPVPKTLDQYVEMLRAFRDKDPNGNNKADEIPFSGRQNFLYSDIFFGAFDVIPDGWKFENNQLVPNIIRPQMKQALEFHRMLYKEQLMDNEIFVQQGKDWDAKIKGAARVGMWLHDANAPDKWLSEVKKGEPNAELINVPAPIGPDGKGGAGMSAPVGNMWAIPKSNKNPEAALKFLEWFFSDEAQLFLNYGLEGEDYTLENGKPKYKYPTNLDEINKESLHLSYLRFVGPAYQADEGFMKGRENADLLMNAMNVSRKEGRLSDALNMPINPTMKAKPELAKNGLWMEMAAKIVTGKEPLDSFDKFVDDWKKRGGDQLIKEATEWYKGRK